MSYFDAVVYSKLVKASGGITQKELDEALETKYDKTGGAITGDVAITGNLTVSGTTTTEKEKQLLVEDNVIVTNANKVALQTLLSGLAINKNADATYGIMYDPTDDTVKFGEGTLDESNKFVFKAGEGRPLAIRADSSQFADGYLVKWDENTKSFVRANLKEDNVSKKISGITFSKNASSVNFDMDKGMSLVNMGEITYADQSKGAISTGIDIPIIPGNGVIMDATEVANHVTVKVDPEHSVYMAAPPTAENAIPMYAKSSKSWIGLPSTPSATASSVATRDANGRMQVGAPAVGGDVANKAYVDGQTPKVGTQTNKNNLTDIEYLGETDIPATPEIGKEYAVTDFISYSDLDSDLQGKIDATATKAYVDTAVAAMIPSIPTWKATAPTTEADKAKVQFTKVTIATADETNFPGMNGRYAIVPGFTNDGFHYGTVVCSQADSAYEFPFIGSITSEMASGTVIKPSVAPTYISVVEPQVTFTYEYLW